MYETARESEAVSYTSPGLDRPEPSIQRALAFLDGEVNRLEECVDSIRVAYRGAASEDYPSEGGDVRSVDKPFGSSEVAQRVQDRAARISALCDQLQAFARRSELSA